MGPGGAELPGAVGNQIAAGVDGGAEAMGSMVGGAVGGPGNQGAKKNQRKGNKTYISAIKSFS